MVLHNLVQKGFHKLALALLAILEEQRRALLAVDLDGCRSHANLPDKRTKQSKAKEGKQRKGCCARCNVQAALRTIGESWQSCPQNIDELDVEELQ